MLVEFVRDHPRLSSGRFSQDFTIKSAQSLWEEITSRLNKVPNGTQKDWKRWRKTWQDLKKGAKMKDAARREYSRQTVGEPPTPVELIEVENKVIKIIPSDPTRTGDYIDVGEIFVFDEGINLREEVIGETPEDHSYCLRCPESDHRLNETPEKMSSTSFPETSSKLSQEMVNVNIDMEHKQKELEYKQKEMEYKLKELEYTQKEMECKQKEMECKQKELEYKHKEMELKQKELEFKHKELECKQKEMECKQIEMECKQMEMEYLEKKLIDKKS
ncbi:sarcolemmal membrane-associated protein-like isoform X2 [Harmonia axyridis]|nr:sarcolemmal membrane-associated protein-like isoform X2 [Harmonia axyridis]